MPIEMQMGGVRAPQREARSRGRLLVGAGLVMALGLATRSHAGALSWPIGDYAPDTLWALLVFLAVLWLRPGLTTRRAFGWALLLSYAIELSQLYQANWINGVRDTRWGGLILGHGFLWSDLLCYTIGIALGAWLDGSFSKRSAT